MGKILIVSAAIAAGCYGFMVGAAGAASAGERWPARYCAELGKFRAIVDGSGSAVERANQRFVLLILQEAHCGVSTRAELEADAATIGTPPRKSSSPAPSQSTHCLSVPMTGGAVATGCN